VSRGSFPILMYHKIDCPASPVHPGIDERRYAVGLESFSRQMAVLKEAGWRGVSLGDALEEGTIDPAEPGRTVVITFDDGNRSDHACALPILTANGLTATFFITGNRVGRPDGLDPTEIRELCAEGMEVGSHGMTHRFLSRLDSAEQENEGRKSRDLLAGITGVPVRYFSLPGGRWSEETLGILESLSYQAVCTSVFGYNAVGGDPFRLRRIPVMRSTSERVFLGYLNRSPVVAYPALAAERSRALARRIFGEKIYQELRARLMRK
jgi:peptidoglycan/xylan/chitin deacetylase (PgdA/CDA1 family)